MLSETPDQREPKIEKMILFRLGKEKTPALSNPIQFCYSFYGAVWVSAYRVQLKALPRPENQDIEGQSVTPFR